MTAAIFCLLNVDKIKQDVQPLVFLDYFLTVDPASVFIFPANNLFFEGSLFCTYHLQAAVCQKCPPGFFR